MKNGFTRIPSDVFPPGVCELTVSYTRKKDKRFKVIKSSEVVDLARTLLYEKGSIEYAEQFFVMMADTSNHVYAYKMLSQGGMVGTVVDARLLFQAALLCHAPALILIHNHPSGNIQPSEADRILTKKISDAGKLLEIKILDHIILTVDSYFSFSDEGLV